MSRFQKLFIGISLISICTCFWQLWTTNNYNFNLTFYESISIQSLSFYYPSNHELSLGVNLTAPQRIKIILYATRGIFVNNPNNKSCGACIFTNDLNEWNNSDAIIFHGRVLKTIPKKYLQWKRPNQVWIYHNLEPAVGMNKAEATFLKTQPFKTMFNWTISFRRDSDIYVPYYQLKRDQNGTKFDHKMILKNMSNKSMVAWIVSNCRASNKRNLLAKTLSEYVTVDIYGRCGTKRCKLSRSKSSGLECRQEISKQYKFYLAFENAYCEDYITEKFYETFNTEMIPIVYGANYTYIKNLPKTSYINVEDYRTVEELANYLKWLDSNPKEYIKYFEARQGLRVVHQNDIPWWCEICKKLWDNFTRPNYEDFYKWKTQSIFNLNETTCYPSDKLPLIIRNLQEGLLSKIYKFFHSTF